MNVIGGSAEGLTQTNRRRYGGKILKVQPSRGAGQAMKAATTTRSMVPGSEKLVETWPVSGGNGGGGRCRLFAYRVWQAAVRPRCCCASFRALP